MRVINSGLTAALALLLPACVIEKIDAIIAEHGVTYWPATESSSGTDAANSSGTSSGTETTAVDSSTTGGAGDSLGTTGVPEVSSTGSSSDEPPDTVCGDKLVGGEEECDDGNDQDGDGCRNDCTRRWTVFVTSEPYMQANLGGITGADYECRHRATKMFLPNGERYMAWVSSSEVEPAGRMYHARGPYVLVDGVQVAANWDALTSGTLEHAINVTEKNGPLEIAVFTGTDTTGLRLPNTQHCSDWTYNDTDQTCWIGDSSATDALWTRGIEAICGGSGSIYCVEQP